MRIDTINSEIWWWGKEQKPEKIPLRKTLWFLAILEMFCLKSQWNAADPVHLLRCTDAFRAFSRKLHQSFCAAQIIHSWTFQCLASLFLCLFSCRMHWSIWNTNNKELLWCIKEVFILRYNSSYRLIYKCTLLIYAANWKYCLFNFKIQNNNNTKIQKFDFLQSQSESILNVKFKLRM